MILKNLFIIFYNLNNSIIIMGNFISICDCDCDCDKKNNVEANIYNPIIKIKKKIKNKKKIIQKKFLTSPGPPYFE